MGFVLNLNEEEEKIIDLAKHVLKVKNKEEAIKEIIKHFSTSEKFRKGVQKEFEYLIKGPKKGENERK